MRLVLDGPLWARIHNHLDDSTERAIFLFATEVAVGEGTWSVIDSYFLDPARDYQDTGEEHLALADHVVGTVIRQAHQAGAAVIEIHGHYVPGPATRISPYDARGLKELVPHVLWRLPGRPYIAMVVGTESFDGLVWTQAGIPETIDELVIGGATQTPTGRSLAVYRATEGGHS
jgi:hypothetical protein